MNFLRIIAAINNEKSYSKIKSLINDGRRCARGAYKGWPNDRTAFWNAQGLLETDEDLNIKVKGLHLDIGGNANKGIAHHVGMKKLIMKKGDKVHSDETYPYKNEIFDSVSIIDFHKYINFNASLKEIKRVLKPGGHIIIKFDDKMFKWYDVFHAKNNYGEKEIYMILKSSGFFVEEMDCERGYMIKAVKPESFF